jgi:hypothetical protein
VRSADPTGAPPSTAISEEASPEIASDPFTETFAEEIYQPFDPLVPLTITFDTGGVGSYFQAVLPEAVSPDVAAVTVYVAVPEPDGRLIVQLPLQEIGTLPALPVMVKA